MEQMFVSKVRVQYTYFLLNFYKKIKKPSPSPPPPPPKKPLSSFFIYQ